MPLWLDATLLLVAPLLWFSGSRNRDDVWELLQKLLAAIAVMVVLLGGRLMVLELLVVLLALRIPGVESRRLRSFSNADEDVAAARR